MLYQPPVFPEPSEIELQVALTYVHFISIFFLLILIIYIYKKMDTKYDFLSIIVVYLFSLVIGITSLNHPHFPISPLIEIFFIMFQTSIFVIYSLKFYETRKR